MQFFQCARASANDLKLSDRRLGRDACAVGGKAAVEAGGVTETPVRSSAWLGVAASRARAARGRSDGDTARGWRVSVDGNKLGSAGNGMASEETGCKSSLNRTRVATPNDLKLSDRRLGRDACAVGGKAAAEAAGVTAAPVRCSAWLGVTWLRRGRCAGVQNTVGLAGDFRTSCRPWLGAGEKRGTRFRWLRIRCAVTNNRKKARRCVPETGARCGNENGETQNKSSDSEGTSER